MTSLEPTRKFQTDLVKITLLPEAETAIRLGIKSQFGDIDLAQVTPFRTCCLLF